MDYEQLHQTSLELARKLIEKSPEMKECVESLFPELKESNDENLRKQVVYAINQLHVCECTKTKLLAWLEKQGEHAKFRDKIQIGDKVTRNQDGVLVNLSQLKRVAKKDEKQGEQKPTDKIEHKFKVGDWVVVDGYTYQITDVYADGYSNNAQGFFPKDREDEMRLWTIQDAKDGDVLANDTIVLIVDHLGTFENRPIIYSWYFADSNKFYGVGPSEPDRWEVGGFHPATKEQRDLLFQKMKEAGYEWDSEKKELKKIEQTPVEEYKITGIGSKNAQGKLGEMIKNLNPAWSEEDDIMKQHCHQMLALLRPNSSELIKDIIDNCHHWLKSLKDRVQPQSQWKPSNEQMKALKRIVSLYEDLQKLR